MKSFTDLQEVSDHPVAKKKKKKEIPLVIKVKWSFPLNALGYFLEDIIFLKKK